jgi:hypothetical protein
VVQMSVRITGLIASSNLPAHLVILLSTFC